MGRIVSFPGIDKDLQKILDADMEEAPARRRAREAFKHIQLGIDHILFKSPSDGLKIKESYEVNSKGLEIFTKSWLPGTSSPRAVELQESWHHLDMQFLQWIILVLVFQKVSIATFRVLMGWLMMPLSISPKSEVSLPMLILHGEADIVTDPSVSKALYEKARSSDKKLKLYKDAYHSLLEGEPDDIIKQVFNDIITWLDEHSKETNAC